MENEVPENRSVTLPKSLWKVLVEIGIIQDMTVSQLIQDELLRGPVGAALKEIEQARAAAIQHAVSAWQKSSEDLCVSQGPVKTNEFTIGERFDICAILFDHDRRALEYALTSKDPDWTPSQGSSPSQVHLVKQLLVEFSRTSGVATDKMSWQRVTAVQMGVHLLSSDQHTVFNAVVEVRPSSFEFQNIHLNSRKPSAVPGPADKPKIVISGVIGVHCSSTDTVSYAFELPHGSITPGFPIAQEQLRAIEEKLIEQLNTRVLGVKVHMALGMGMEAYQAYKHLLAPRTAGYFRYIPETDELTLSM